jgi:hypothetical protein
MIEDVSPAFQQETFDYLLLTNPPQAINQNLGIGAKQLLVAEIDVLSS